MRSQELPEFSFMCMEGSPVLRFHALMRTAWLCTIIPSKTGPEEIYYVYAVVVDTHVHISICTDPHGSHVNNVTLQERGYSARTLVAVLFNFYIPCSGILPNDLEAVIGGGGGSLGGGSCWQPPGKLARSKLSALSCFICYIMDCRYKFHFRNTKFFSRERAWTWKLNHLLYCVWSGHWSGQCSLLKLEYRSHAGATIECRQVLSCSVLLVASHMRTDIKIRFLFNDMLHPQESEIL